MDRINIRTADLGYPGFVIIGESGEEPGQGVQTIYIDPTTPADDIRTLINGIRAAMRWDAERSAPAVAGREESPGHARPLPPPTVPRALWGLWAILLAGMALAALVAGSVPPPPSPAPSPVEPTPTTPTSTRLRQPLGDAPILIPRTASPAPTR